MPTPAPPADGSAERKTKFSEPFELVVDSSFEGVRKPEPEIYARTLERLALPGEACVFVDDLEVNLPPAEALGMHPVDVRIRNAVEHGSVMPTGQVVDSAAPVAEFAH